MNVDRLLSTLVLSLFLAACKFEREVGKIVPPSRPAFTPVGTSATISVGDEFSQEIELSDILDPSPKTNDLNANDVTEPVEFCISDPDTSLCRTLGPNARFDFDVVMQGVTYPTRFVTYGTGKPVYSDAYQKAHKGQFTYEVPEFLELVKVIFSLSDYAAENPSFLNRGTDYYQDMQTSLESLREHAAVKAVDETFRNTNYSVLIHQAYAFELDSAGNIQPSNIYHSAFNGDNNTYADDLAQFQSFANELAFRKFKASQKTYYAETTAQMKDKVDVAKMKTWLSANFPDVTPYDHIRVIYSPLTGSSQSAKLFRDEPFKELLLFVNVPFVPDTVPMSDDGRRLLESLIIFTEYNHGYLSPTREKYLSDITAAIGDADKWGIGNPSSNYSTPGDMFDEMMNWALFNLYAMDLAPEEDKAWLLENTKTIMVNDRGFLYFREFSDHLEKLYVERSDEETLADLYPKIIDWVETNRPQ